MRYLVLNQFKTKAFFCAMVLAFLAVFSLVFAGEAQAAYGLSENFKQVKTADNPAVYYLDHSRGLKKSYVNAEAYLSYGNEWGDIKIISAAELDRWSDFYLAKTADSPAVFYIQGNRKAVIANEQEFLAHNFRWSDIIIVSAVDLAGYVDAELDAIYISGNLYASSLPENGSLAVSVVDVGVNSNQIPLGSINNLAAVFNFQAGDEAVEINKIKLNLEGLFTENMISRVYLVVGDNINHEYRGQMSNKVVSFYLNDKIFISPNSTRQLKFYIDTQYPGQKGSNNNLKITLPESGSISANAAISGNFPLASAQYQLVYAEGYLGKVKAVETSLNRNLDVFVGNSNQELANFNISEISGSEDALINYVVFKNNGTARNTDLANFVLKDKNNRKIAQVEKMSGNEIIFSLGNYKIKSLNHSDFRVFGDIISGAEKTINLELTDIKVIGARTGYGLLAEISNFSENLQIKRKSISVTAKELNSKSSSYSRQDGTLLGLFELSNAGSGADLESIKVIINRGQNTPNLVKSVRMVDYETGVIFDTVNPTADGVMEFEINQASLSSGKKILLGFICEIPETTKQGDIYQVIIDSITYESGRDYYSDKIEVAGKQLAISKSNLYVYGTKGEEDAPSFTKGQDKIKIAKFYVEAAYGDDTLITSLTFSKGGSSNAISYENGFSDLKLYINTKKVGETIANPSGETYEFNNFSYKLKAGERATIYLYADTENDLKIKELQLKLTNLVASSYASGVESTISGLSADSYQVLFHEAKAEISALSGGSTSSSQAGSLAASFKVKNTGNEDLDLNYITLVTTKNGFSQSLGYKNLTIRESASNKSIGKVSKPVSGANKIKLNYTIPAGEEKTFQVYVDAEKNLPQETFELHFSGLIARGEESDIYANIAGDPTASVLVNSQGTSFNSNQNSNAGGSANTVVNNGYSFIRPVDGGYVSHGFGADAGDGYKFGVHNGVDFVVPQKTKVYAAADGVVSYVFNGAYTDAASYIEIEHQNGFVTRYGHLYSINVKIGDRVEQGKLIGLSGGELNTYGAGANTTGAHLHFDMTLNDKFVDPEKYL